MSFFSKNKRLETNRYFEEDDDDVFSSQATSSKNLARGVDVDDEIDPLDAFMNTVHETVKKEKEESVNKPLASRPEVLGMNEDDSHDEFEAIIPGAARSSDDEDTGYHSNEDVKRNPSGGFIQPLPGVDHKSIAYCKFRRNFFRIHPGELELHLLPDIET
jgi:hypothetical protein